MQGFDLPVGLDNWACIWHTNADLIVNRPAQTRVILQNVAREANVSRAAVSYLNTYIAVVEKCPRKPPVKTRMRSEDLILQGAPAKAT